MFSSDRQMDRLNPLKNDYGVIDEYFEVLPIERQTFILSPQMHTNDIPRILVKLLLIPQYNISIASTILRKTASLYAINFLDNLSCFNYNTSVLLSHFKSSCPYSIPCHHHPTQPNPHNTRPVLVLFLA